MASTDDRILLERATNEDKIQQIDILFDGKRYSPQGAAFSTVDNWTNKSNLYLNIPYDNKLAEHIREATCKNYGHPPKAQVIFFRKYSNPLIVEDCTFTIGGGKITLSGRLRTTDFTELVAHKVITSTYAKEMQGRDKYRPDLARFSTIIDEE